MMSSKKNAKSRNSPGLQRNSDGVASALGAEGWAPVGLAEHLQDTRAIRLTVGHAWNVYLYALLELNRQATEDKEDVVVNVKAFASVDDPTKAHAKRLAARTGMLAERLNRRPTSTVDRYPVRLTSPVLIGVGAPHPKGIAISTDFVRGVPRIPGSSLKGLLRAAATWLTQQPPMEGTVVITEEDVAALFGSAPPPAWNARSQAGSDSADPDFADGSRSDRGRQGHLRVFDAFPTRKRGSLVELDIVNPHHTDYLVNGKAPIEQSPTPVFVPRIAAGARLEIVVVHEGACVADCQAKVRRVVEALETYGALGAHASVGYGTFRLDTQAP
jgi:CRISPR type III-B/RAMP module RAMP protein Cmr6